MSERIIIDSRAAATETASETTTAVSRSVRICNQRGLHARAAAKFVKAVGGFAATVTVSRCGQSVGGDSIMGLMMLAAGPGCDIVIEASGEGATDALEALTALVERGFDET